MFRNSGEQIVGLDIGGANLKAAVWQSVTEARAASLNFPLWKQPDRLAEGVRSLLTELNATGHFAVTMTGELADCFTSRREGVSRIIDQLGLVVPPEYISVYTVDGQWFTADQARENPWDVAASNWHALASWLAQWPPTRHAFQCGVLVDIGSTTVDVLPVINGHLATEARSDRDRLQCLQLVYTGVRRTPVCAVLSSVVIDGTSVPLMAELFATVDDAYVLLGYVDEVASDCDSADSRPRTQPFAAMRLARMIGEDAQRMSPSQLKSLAEQVVQAQAALVAQAIEANLDRVMQGTHVPHLICSGHGLSLWEQTIRKLKRSHPVEYLNQHAPAEVSRCAPAAAVAWLRLFNEE